MSQDSSLIGTFDLNSQTGVMSILASIRGSKLSAPEKNELRDLVFLYTNGGGDASVRIALEQKLVAHKIVPVQVQPTAPAGPSLAFGSYRPTPTFKKAPQVASLPVSIQVPPPVVNPAVSAEPVTSAPFVPAVNPAIQAPVVVEQVPIVSVPVFAPVIKVATPVLAPEAVVTPPIPAPVSGEVNYIERIRQIKTAVNSKVGNPVNLVDINNEVGREYMNALLEAMKKLSSGAVSEMGPAMKRLESSYIAVEAAIAGHNEPIPPPPVAAVLVTPIVSPVATPALPVVSTPISVPEPLPPPAPVIKNEVPLPAPAPILDLPPRPVAPMTTPPVPLPVTPPVFVVPVPQTPVPAPQPLPSVATYEEMDGSPVINPVVTSFALSDQKKILTPSDLPDASSVSTGAAGDPLSTKEVDDGLNQLLSDWTLFKKSGLFGTGPKGREHPLFKKIADLQVPLLLAGRFDGATQEIRQSITDYMNGWRYEQGIIYQPGETFERYLRRVIKHIIDLQKKHKQP